MVNKEEQVIQEEIKESFSDIKEDYNTQIGGTVEDLARSIFDHCTGGPDCSC